MRDIARQHRDAVARRSASIHELPALPGCRSDLYLVLEETKRSCFYDVLIVIRGNGCRYNGARWGQLAPLAQTRAQPRAAESHARRRRLARGSTAEAAALADGAGWRPEAPARGGGPTRNSGTGSACTLTGSDR